MTTAAKTTPGRKAGREPDTARDVRAAHGYDDTGRLTPPMLTALLPFLAAPIEDRYIETTPATKGKPYTSTGIRSVQVQIDRMNEVLGLGHWRVLTRYEDSGALCHATVVVGNDLAACSLDATGGLVVGDATVLAVRDGWGGHSRGSGRGDLYKGSETNALKRVLARFGPGAGVYRLDFDDDVNRSNDPRVAARPEPPVDADATLRGLLADGDDALRALRARANDGMERYGLTAEQRATRLLTAQSEADVTALIARIDAAMDAEAAGNGS